MTTNIDHAVKHILDTEEKYRGHNYDIYPDDLRRWMQALASAGLLTPDPIEPEGIEHLSWGTIAQWHPELGLGWYDDGRVLDTTPEDLRHEAACLLSAAAYAENNKEKQ